MNLAGVRADVTVIDELLREILIRPVDLDAPDWLAELEHAPRPVDEAGVATGAGAALETPRWTRAPIRVTS
ncbi:hypothetical protein ACFY36_29140 [Actinoplanes sp. NPDC000266]